jgi:hypothetical protein
MTWSGGRTALAIAAAAFAFHLPFLRPGGPSVRAPEALTLATDEGTVLYDSLRIAGGEVMYRDFFQFHGPVFYHLYAALFGLTGGPSMTAARTLHNLTASVSAALLALLVARFAGRSAGVAAAAVHALLLAPMWPHAYPQWLAEAFGLGALVLLSREQPGRAARFGAGALLGLACATIQSLGLPMLVAAVAVPAILGRTGGGGGARSGLRNAAWTGAGALVVLVPVVALFASRGALAALVDHTFFWPARHYAAGQSDAPAYAAYTGAFVRTHAGLAAPWRAAGAISLWLIPCLPFAAGLAALGAGSAAFLRNDRGRPGSAAAARVAIVALAAVLPIWIGPTRRDITHVAFLGSFGLAGAGVLIHVLPPRAGALLRALLLAAAGVVFLNYASKAVRSWKPSRAMGDWVRQVRALPDAEWLDRNLAPDERIVVGSYGGFYYMFVRPAAVSFTYLPARRNAYYSDAQWRQIAGEIATRAPGALVLVEHQGEDLRAIRPEIGSLYRRQGTYLHVRARRD